MLEPRRILRITCKIKLAIYLCLLVCICIRSLAREENLPLTKGRDLALKDHLIRFRRQSSSSLQLNSNAANSNQRPAGLLSSVASGSNPIGNNDQPDSSNLDDKPQDEVMSSLKCDFGSADAPDLCKFKILDQENPLGKSLTSWSLGSGRSALFQGGPLVDASQSNDTSGGYIFYETSNPYASFVSNQSYAPLSLGAAIHRHQAPSGHNEILGANDYSTITATNLMKQSTNHRNPQHHEPISTNADIGQQSYQHIASGRLSIGANLPGPTFISPNLTAPGPSGMCLSFQYAIQGLSAEELRIYVLDHKTERPRQIWASSESAASNWTKAEVLYSVNNRHSLMFSAASSSSAALKDLQQRRFRGHIALDDIDINKHDPLTGEAACKGHCNFDGDLCGWTNADNGQEDDFDWSFGRGSDNLFTGPARDFTSSSNNELTGSYLFTDSGYPRRPGDRAILISPVFQPTPVNDAMCMRLAVHMFGNGIGSLGIKIRYTDEPAPGPVQPVAPGSQPTGGAAGGGEQPPGGRPFATSARSSLTSSDGSKPNELVIWEMSGEAGNSWHQAQTSVSSSKSPFQVLIEGVIGENHLGNIAIDEISFSSGPCPTSPPVASKNYGDCTFEQSMCYWRNPDADIHLDDLDWVRSADEQSIHGPNFDHTLKKRSGSYLKLENTFREPKSGTRAFLLSPIFQPKASGSVQCLSFYYYMFMRSISSSGPNLGTIRVYLASNNELVPIWRLTNPISSPNWKHGRASLATAMVDGQPIAPTKLFQIAFEGIWGDATGGAIALDDITVFDGACDIMPAEAKSVPGECTFDVDMCSWSNKTYEVASAGDAADSSRSPFLQSVNSAPGSRLMAPAPSSNKRASWQLATVDSRPVNLQDHTYKAPIGYAYVDVLDSLGHQMAFPLQSDEVTVQSGQQLTTCLSFWFAAYGRQDGNQLNVYMTQASAPPVSSEDGPSAAGSATPGPSSSGRNNLAGGGPPAPGGAQPAAGRNQAGSVGGGLAAPAIAAVSSGSAPEGDAENSDAWKLVDGKLLWSISLRNITETSRRKWLYGQVTLRADSNHIVRFVALTNDGGFALDDISYFDGACETRPAQARVQAGDEEAQEQPSQPGVAPKGAK